MSTIVPAARRPAGFSTIFWKIQGWLERRSILRRTAGRPDAGTVAGASAMSVRPVRRREKRDAGPSPGVPAGYIKFLANSRQGFLVGIASFRSLETAFMMRMRRFLLALALVPLAVLPLSAR